MVIFCERITYPSALLEPNHLVYVQGLKKALRQVLLLLPPYCLVGIISYGSLVYIHQLTREMPTVTCFQATANTGKQEVGAHLYYTVITFEQTMLSSSQMHS